MVVGRGAHELIPPIAFNFWRWLLALLIATRELSRRLMND
jgi:hypothetical protein